MSWFVGCLMGLAALFAERGAISVRRDEVRRRLSVSPKVPPAASEHRRPLPGWAPWSALGAVAGLLVGRSPLFASLGGLVAYGAFRVRARMRAGRAATARDEQLADAVRTIASALRAGLSVPQSLSFAAGEASPPLDGSLREVVDALDVGVPADEALDRWADTVGTDDARLVAGVLHLHRRSGGDLPVVLDQVAETLRDRQAATRELRALTAQARLSGAILGVLPIGFFAFLWLTSRSEIEGALATPAGLGAVLLGLTLEGLAFLWIRKLLEVRW
ncbi:MAG: type II secretion system F family protein [Actinomycetota bacterium]